MADINQREFVLAQLRAACLRARIAANEIEYIGVSLKHGMIDTQTAIDWLADAGALGYVDEMEQME